MTELVTATLPSRRPETPSTATAWHEELMERLRSLGYIK